MWEVVVVAWVRGWPRVVESVDITWCPPQVSAFACAYRVYFWRPGLAQILPSPLCLYSHILPCRERPAWASPSPGRKGFPSYFSLNQSPSPLPSVPVYLSAQLILSCHYCFIPFLRGPASQSASMWLGALAASQGPGQWGRKSKDQGGKEPASLSLINSACSRHLISLILRALQVKWGSGLSDL